MTTSLVTIGIPTYNRAPSLRRAVMSALAQDHPALEIVISDNASSDGTEELCWQLAADDRRVRYIRHPVNIGAAANFMAVLAAAESPYFMWLADDDELEQNYVSECLAVLEAEPGTVLVAGGARLWHEHGGIERETPVNLVDGRPDRRVLGYYRTVGRNSVFYGVARTAVLRTAGPLRTVMGGDWLFVSALAFSGGVRTVDTTGLIRSAGGTSGDLRRVARSFGMGPIARRLPRVALPMNVGRDLTSSPVYRTLPPHRRVGLAVASAASVGWRLGIRHHLVRALRGIQRGRPASSRGGQARSRSEMVSSPTSGQAMPRRGSSQATPRAASGT